MLSLKLSWSDSALLMVTVVSPISHDNMVKEINAHHFTSPLDALCQPIICLARRKTARRMIMTTCKTCSTCNKTPFLPTIIGKKKHPSRSKVDHLWHTLKVRGQLAGFFMPNWESYKAHLGSFPTGKWWYFMILTIWGVGMIGWSAICFKNAINACN